MSLSLPLDTSRKRWPRAVFAIPKALKLAGLKLADIDVIELNSVRRAIARVIKEAGLDPERVNPNGGAIALGHPLDAPERS